MTLSGIGHERGGGPERLRRMLRKFGISKAVDSRLEYSP